MTEERWKPIPGCKGYDVSDHGRARSYMKQMGPHRDGWAITDSPRRYLKLAPCPSGYLHTAVASNGKRWSCTIQQLVMLAFVGPRPQGMVICHNDGDPTNNHLGNLRYDTQSANVCEAMLHSSRKFTPEQVLDIRNRRANGALGKDLAAEYDVTPGTIYHICTYHTYKAIGGPRTGGA